MSFSLATSESWKDREGNCQERTEWHRVCIYTDGLGTVAERYLKKGSLVYIEGKLETRKWERDGQDHYTTEIALRPFNGTMQMLGEPAGSGGREARGEAGASAEGGERAAPGRTRARGQQRAKAGVGGPDAPKGDMDDDIPF